MKSWALLTMLIIFCGAIVAGCASLTPAQEEKLQTLVDRGAKIQAEAGKAWSAVEYFTEVYDSLKGKADAIREAIASGKVPAKEGIALLEEIEAEKGNMQEQANSARQAFDNLVAEGTAVRDEINALRKEGVPWYVILGRVGYGLVVTGGGMYIRSLIKKAGFLGQVIGVLSRAGDAMGHDEFGPKVEAEIINAPGLTNDNVRPLHHASTANEL